MALLAHRHRDWGCLLVLYPQTSNVALGVCAVASGSPALKMRTSAASSHPERASLESCCSASFSHGTARTEAQRLGVLACLTPSNFKSSLGGLCSGPPAPLLRKCKRLQVARSQKELGWNDFAWPHLPMALLTQRQRDWGCLLVLPPSNFKH